VIRLRVSLTYLSEVFAFERRVQRPHFSLFCVMLCYGINCSFLRCAVPHFREFLAEATDPIHGFF
jgi:hypothetical protein